MWVVAWPALGVKITGQTHLAQHLALVAESTKLVSVAAFMQQAQQGSYVLVVGEDDQPRFQAVELGSSSGDQTAILKGLDPQTRVFIDLPPWAEQNSD